ncbi:proline--tRNA ligase [Synechococcus sp. RSCCF101]|uniref:proline--tRNA ligase n=1 Tax=Synechococcus sp. RSCCF101 TaxID=2511069 RepID=UPI00124454A3|nr:proline--tRNA ligase [Synechococcus sp. RSCCF101]QEY31386.1 proline--tRNA ligase [Synechococcus sp. RSCCF101]
MRVSRLMLVTLRDVPAEAELTSHRLLLRAGYMRRLASGVYAYLPLLWRVLNRISAVIREEMEALGALETLLPQLQPAEIWQRSGRWSAYTDGEGIMFHLRDRQDRCFGLGPTHEEVVTTLAAELLRSYRQLPVSIYQIQTKFRDEIRPRFGLMRSREFIMKDAYSFHADSTDLAEMYDRMDGAYRRIFRRCGLDVLGVEADSGAIGGAASREFMVTAEAGEDLILTSADGRYAANQERAVSLAAAAVPLPAPASGSGEAPELMATPGQSSIDDLCAAHGLHPSQIVKVLLLVARLSDAAPQPVLVAIRGDQQLNMAKLSNVLSERLPAAAGSVLDVSPIDAAGWSAQGLGAMAWGFLGPDLPDDVLGGARTWQPRFERLLDATAADLPSFICGANLEDRHRSGVSWERLPGMGTAVDLRSALPGDRCCHDPAMLLQASRGIEVGHIFQLGRKYSDALAARFSSETGAEESLWMGCYGIGVSRLAQAAVEQHHDDQGICWPLPIAPYEAIVVIANAADETQLALAEAMYARLREAGIDALLDDRRERAGVKFKDADLIGIPWRVVVGRGAAQDRVELVERRTRESRELDSSEAIALLVDRVRLGRCPAGDP